MITSTRRSCQVICGSALPARVSPRCVLLFNRSTSPMLSVGARRGYHILSMGVTSATALSGSPRRRRGELHPAGQLPPRTAALATPMRSCWSRTTAVRRSPSESAEMMNLDEYEALLLGAEEEEGEGEEPLLKTETGAPPLAPSTETSAKTSAGSGVALTRRLVEMVKEVLPPDGRLLRLTDLTPSIDMELLEELPPPPGSSCMSVRQFLEMHPQYFRLQQVQEGASPQRWYVQRCDVVATGTADGIPTSSSSSSSAASSADKMGSGGEDVDRLDLNALLMEEELSRVLQDTSCCQSKQGPPHCTPRPRSREQRRRLQPVDEGGTTPSVAGERLEVWQRLWALLHSPEEVLTIAQLRQRIESEDLELLEWLRATGSSTEREDGSGPVGLRRLLWRHASEAKAYFDYDAASPEGWISRPGVLQRTKGSAVWTKESATSRRVEDSAPEVWDVELDLDKEESAEVEEELDEDSSSPSGSTVADAAPPTGVSSPPSKREQRRRQRQLEKEERERQEAASPEALLAEHTRLAEERGWRSPREILDLLVECVPTFPVPVDQLVTSDVLLKLFGMNVSMKRLVLVYRYYFVYEKDTEPAPTVCLHPEWVVGQHPQAGIANQYYKRWEHTVFSKRAEEVVNPLLPATESSSPDGHSSSTPTPPASAASGKRPLYTGGFVPLRRTIKSRVTLSAKVSSPSSLDAAAAPTSLSSPLLQSSTPSPPLTAKEGKKGELKPPRSAPLSDAVVAMHDLLQGTTSSKRLASLEVAPPRPVEKPPSPSPPSPLRAGTKPGPSPEPLFGPPSTSPRTRHKDMVLEALRAIYEEPPPTAVEDNAEVVSATLVLQRALLSVPFTHFISIEEAARRCGGGAATEAERLDEVLDTLEDLLDRSQPPQARYATFLLHTPTTDMAAGASSSAQRRRRRLRLRPLWITPNSVGDLSGDEVGATPLPASFLRKLLPTWRPLHKILERMPAADREALEGAAAHSASMRDYLRLFGRSSCWVEDHPVSGDTAPSRLRTDRHTRVRRYKGEWEMDDVEPLCVRVLYCCCRADTAEPLETLIERAAAAEERARRRLGLAVPAPSGEGVAHMLAQWRTERPDLPQWLSQQPTLFEAHNSSGDAVIRIKRRSLIGAGGSAFLHASTR